MLRASAVLALGFGAFLAVGELVRNWGNWQWWPFWLVDYIAVALLLAGGALTLRGRPGGHTLLCGAWGFTTAMFWMSFWGHVEHIHEASEGNVAQRPLTIVIGVLWGLSILGFVTAAVSVRRAGT